ncbi:MAG TPA: disulfide bond formation protein B [Burkholderiales bacterium]|nr:disulfide bond formation protein B [Burkholderiales bacterium]
MKTVVCSRRAAYGLGALICAGLLGFALYLQYYEFQDPCPLCILQRTAFIALLIVFVAAALHGPGRTATYVYCSLLVLIALTGGSVAVRQVWLQHLPADRIPACGPGIEYMLDRFPLTLVLQKILRGSGECADVSWRFLGLSIAEWSLIWFVMLAALALSTAFCVAWEVRSDQARISGVN